MLKRVESTGIYHDLVKDIDAIYIGEFDLLEQRDISALYYHDTIYITNDQENENDIFDDLIHEIAHAIESSKKEYIYGDLELEREFMKKRRQVIFHLLGCIYITGNDLTKNILTYTKQKNTEMYYKQRMIVTYMRKAMVKHMKRHTNKIYMDMYVRDAH